MYQNLTDLGNNCNLSDFSDSDRKEKEIILLTENPSSNSSMKISPKSNSLTPQTEAEDEDLFDFEEKNESVKVSIGGLTPVISPLNGTMLELSGRNIEPNASVLVDGVFSDFLEFLPGSLDGSLVQRLVFLSPRLLEGGFKTVELRNADDSAILENVLFYADE